MTPQEMMAEMVAEIADKTGKTWQEWTEVARASGIDSHKALTVHLKTVHGLKHNQAQFLAWEITDPGRLESYSRPKDLVDELYSGKKAGLRPLYDAIFAAGKALGPDVEHNVCKTYSSLSTGRIFVMINPRTQKGVDVDLALPEGVTGKGLEAQKNSNPHFQHKVRVTELGQVDGELRRLMAEAAEYARK